MYLKSKIQDQGCWSGKIPVRFQVALMLFLINLTYNILNVNMSIVIPVLVHHNHSDTTPLSSDLSPRFHWSHYEQSMVLTAYYWGKIITNFFGGVISERFGGRNVFGYCLYLSGIVTALSPFFASHNFWYMFVARFLIGVFGGIVTPSGNWIVSKWAPVDERGKFITVLMGGTSLGPLVSWNLAGFIIKNWGWEPVFYITALVSLLLGSLWFYLVSNTPEEHPRIEKDEQEYIKNSLSGRVGAVKLIPPVKQVFTSMPFWALFFLHFGSSWGFYCFLNVAPKFMNEALGFNIAESGFLSSLPYLARTVCGLVFGSIGDFIRKNNFITVTTTRKLFCIPSHVIPGFLFIVLCMFGSNPFACVAIIIIASAFNGAVTTTSQQNIHDLAPNYAGTLSGIINCAGVATGLISPILVAYFTKDGSTLREWQNVFLIASFLYLVPAFLFFVFGSGKVQSWNDNKKSVVHVPDKSESTNL